MSLLGCVHSRYAMGGGRASKRPKFCLSMYYEYTGPLSASPCPKCIGGTWLIYKARCNFDTNIGIKKMNQYLDSLYTVFEMYILSLIQQPMS